MPAYVLVDLRVEQMEAFMTYVAAIGDLIQAHGGRYLVRGAEPLLVHGEAGLADRSVVIEFPSRERAEAFLAARTAAGLADLFARATSSRILLVDGAGD